MQQVTWENNVVIGNANITGNGNTIINFTDQNGNTIINTPMIIWNWAKWWPWDIVIGAHAGCQHDIFTELEKLKSISMADKETQENINSLIRELKWNPSWSNLKSLWNKIETASSLAWAIQLVLFIKSMLGF